MDVIRDLFISQQLSDACKAFSRLFIISFFLWSFSEAEAEATTKPSSFEAMKENMDETVAHVAMKTGLKPWHVVMAIIRKHYLQSWTK